jgi:hypothetical protein
MGAIFAGGVEREAVLRREKTKEFEGTFNKH